MIAARSAGTEPVLLLTFHGTGGDEWQLHEAGRSLLPEAHVVSPRGEVSEGGALRFFRRRAEGVYDMDDLRARTAAMAEFAAAEAARVGAARVAAIGYSNGANILASVLLSRPEVIDDAVLMHPLIPWEPAPADLGGRRVLVTAGRRDPIGPAPVTQRLIDALSRMGADVEAVWHEGGHEAQPQEWAAAERFLRGPRSAIR